MSQVLKGWENEGRVSVFAVVYMAGSKAVYCVFDLFAFLYINKCTVI